MIDRMAKNTRQAHPSTSYLVVGYEIVKDLSVILAARLDLMQIEMIKVY
jgi:hypothetical protein